MPIANRRICPPLPIGYGRQAWTSVGDAEPTGVSFRPNTNLLFPKRLCAFSKSFMVGRYRYRWGVTGGAEPTGISFSTFSKSFMVGRYRYRWGCMKISIGGCPPYDGILCFLTYSAISKILLAQSFSLTSAGPIAAIMACIYPFLKTRMWPLMRTAH